LIEAAETKERLKMVKKRKTQREGQKMLLSNII
jgi:hypothetical protein